MATALIVEDHPDQAEMVARLLRLRDFEPIVAGDGETGLELARQHRARRRPARPDAPRHQRLRRLPPPPDRPRDDAHPRRHAHRPERRRRTGSRASASAPTPTSPSLTASTSCSTPSPPPAPGGAEMERGQPPGRDPRRAQQRDHPAPGPQRLPAARSASRPRSTTSRSCSCARPSWRWRRTPSSGATSTSRTGWSTITLPGLRRPRRDHHPRPGAGLRPRATCPTPRSPTTRSRTSTSATSSASAPGGFGLLICKGMVDELRYNDVGNEVTLIKRFRSQEAGLT